jgi:hypothetical protein
MMNDDDPPTLPVHRVFMRYALGRWLPCPESEGTLRKPVDDEGRNVIAVRRSTFGARGDGVRGWKLAPGQDADESRAIKQWLDAEARRRRKEILQ